VADPVIKYIIMKIHKEGHKVIPWALIILAVIDIIALSLLSINWIFYSVIALSVISAIIIIFFFRVPDRQIKKNRLHILAPADGEIVEILNEYEKDYFKEERIQISIFMSIFDIHQNRAPVDGEIVYQKYKRGAYYPAFVKKSSEKNERCTTVFKMENGTEIMTTQIAGTVAQRILTYKQTGEFAEQGEEFGFIRFGSRVDIFLPPSFTVNVKLHQKSVGGVTVIATQK
jgi:phosphatidylserine decarboxylase